MVTADYALGKSQRISLLNGLSGLLPTLQQDPTPAITLVMRLIDVPEISFGDVLELEPQVDFAAGLLSESEPINMVILALLEKAKCSEGDGG